MSNGAFARGSLVCLGAFLEARSVGVCFCSSASEVGIIKLRLLAALEGNRIAWVFNLNAVKKLDGIKILRITATRHHNHACTYQRVRTLARLHGPTHLSILIPKITRSPDSSEPRHTDGINALSYLHRMYSTGMHTTRVQPQSRPFPPSRAIRPVQQVSCSPRSIPLSLNNLQVACRRGLGAGASISGTGAAALSASYLPANAPAVYTRDGCRVFSGSVAG